MVVHTPKQKVAVMRLKPTAVKTQEEEEEEAEAAAEAAAEEAAEEEDT